MGDLKQRISEDTKAAMRAKDKARVGVFRMLGAAIKQVEVDERKSLDDDGVIGVLEKMIKQRRESHAQYSEAGRADLADQEAFELQLIAAYMPPALTDAEIDALIGAALADTGAGSMKEMGKVMGVLRPKLKGRADMGAVSAKVKQRLS